MDIAVEILKNGWAKLKEFKREPTEEDLKKREAEAEAKDGGKGVWNPDGPQVREDLFLRRAPCSVAFDRVTRLRSFRPRSGIHS